MTQPTREPTRITQNELKAMMDRGEPVVILDVRTDQAFDSSQVKIKGAVRIPPEDIEQRLNQIPRDKEIVTYCT